ncbi:MAG: hypothetical protein GX640_16825 [Fibrobacter sp.]|nr:hypothetical protein [Fibrobacter sp.]
MAFHFPFLSGAFLCAICILFVYFRAYSNTADESLSTHVSVVFVTSTLQQDYLFVNRIYCIQTQPLAKDTCSNYRLSKIFVPASRHQHLSEFSQLLSAINHTEWTSTNTADTDVVAEADLVKYCYLQADSEREVKCDE